MSTDLIETASLPTHSLTVEEMVGADNFRRELERFFTRGWLFACHIAQLPQIGDYLTLEMAGRRFFVIRTADGVAAHYNVCPHRGSELVSEPAGNCGRTITCPYHAWSFRHQGDFAGAPFRPDNLEGGSLGLQTLQTEVWNSLVFITFSADPIASVGQQLEGVDLSPWRLDRTKVASVLEYDVEANWKILWENALECYHCGPNHPELRKVANIIRDGAQPNHLSAGEFDYRPTYPLLDGVVSSTLDGSYGCNRLLGGGIAPPAGQGFLQWHTSIFEIILPPDHVHVMTYLPLSPSRSRVRLLMLVDEDATEGVDFDLTHLNGLHQVVRSQDDVVCTRVQRGMESGAYQPGPYNPSYEFQNQNFVRLYRQVMA